MRTTPEIYIELRPEGDPTVRIDTGIDIAETARSLAIPLVVGGGQLAPVYELEVETHRT